MEQTSGGEEEEAMEIESVDFGEKIQTSRTRVCVYLGFLFFVFSLFLFFHLFIRPVFYTRKTKE